MTPGILLNAAASSHTAVIGDPRNDENLIPGFTGMMAVLATRNLRRGLALQLPSGQGMANFFGIAPMTAAQLTQDLPANESGAAQRQRRAAVEQDTRFPGRPPPGGRSTKVVNQLGPVGARIVSDTFIRILKRDGGSYLNASGEFTPFLPSAASGDFTFADLMVFAGVTQP